MHRSATRLIAAVFFLQPLAFGNWLARIPQVRDALGLSPAELALALLGAPAGIVATLPFAGRLVARLGGRKTILLAFLAFLPVAGLPALAMSGPTLFAALAIVGATMSVLELGLNVEADRIEADAGRFIMSTCHGFWSLGLMVGNLIGAGLAVLGVPLAPAFFGLSLAVLPVAILASLALPRMEGEPQPSTSVFFRPDAALLGVCTFVFGVALTEGAAADWSAILLRDRFGWPNDLAALAFAPFAGMVALGRFFGDALRARLGRVAAARLTGTIAIGGGLLVALTPGAALALLGLGLLGFGVSTGFPLGVTAAAGLGGRAPAANVAFLSMVALSGFLVGPPLIGGVAQHAGIQMGLASVLPALLLSLLFTGALRPVTVEEAVA